MTGSTIFALATAPGRAAVAVIRISGPACLSSLQALGAKPPPPRRASLRKLRDGRGDMLDEALVLWMPGPDSYTGEDSLELHLHGGFGVVSAVEARLAEIGLSPAEPGAFTRRAFEAGRIDLVQAEAVGDLIDAETEAQRRQALDQLGGAASRQHEAWRASLTGILAALEAAVDFPDEEIPKDVATRTLGRLQALAEELQAAAAERRGELIRSGFRVALVGAPNAGKSSLFNALLGRDAAIVTDIPGTTRDVIEAEMVLGGRKVILADLAGLRDSHDPIEQEGVRRARAWAEAADLRLHLDGALWPRDADPRTDLPIASKADVQTSRAGSPVSTKTGEGIESLREAIARRAIAATTGASAPPVTRERHRRALVHAARHLREAMNAGVKAPELMAEDVRLAARSLQSLTGRIDAEAILGEVFATFCIGK